MEPNESRLGRRRVVVTGMGAVTPLGLDVATSWEAMLKGLSGVDRITSLPVDDLPVRIAGEVKDFVADTVMPRKVSRRLDLFAQYALAAAMEAVDQSGLEIDEEAAPRVGVLMGSGYGAVRSIEQSVRAIGKRGPRAISPFCPLTEAIDSAAVELSLHFGASGPSRSISSACATGTDAIGEAADWIRHGRSDVVIAGGAENCLTAVDIAGSANARALSRRMDDPERASRPFDEDRDGFVMSAGAGALVLEERGRALRRGAPVLAEVIGYASSSDAHHLTAPHPEGTGAYRAVLQAFQDARISPEQVDCVNAHGTGTKLNDAAEVALVHRLFGNRVKRVPMSSIKSMTGHMIGAAGAVEAITAVQTLRTGIVPPTINCDRPIDPSLNFVAHQPQEHNVRMVMSNSFGFGGHNSVLLLSKEE
ncbi:beta-ketoacyl-ACP synthase II [Nocardiopsis terrae]